MHCVTLVPSYQLHTQKVAQIEYHRLKDNWIHSSTVYVCTSMIKIPLLFTLTENMRSLVLRVIKCDLH